MNEKRRDHRIQVDLPFLVSDPDSESSWQAHTLDVSPTGLLLRFDADQAPPKGKLVNVSVQGPAEAGWEHINTRTMRVVRIGEQETGLTYTDLDTV